MFAVLISSLPDAASPNGAGRGAPTTQPTGEILWDVNVVPAGFPLVLNDKLQPCEPISAFLIDLYFIQCSVKSVKSLSTYAEHLANWFASLERSNINWLQVDQSTLGVYRQYLQREAGGSAKLSPVTVNSRLSTVLRFYKWASSAHFKLKPHFVQYLDIYSSNELPWGRATRKKNPLLARNYGRIPRDIEEDDIRKIFRELPREHRWVAKWALATGGRRKEILSITVEKILAAASDASSNQLVLIEVETKGGGTRPLYVPRTLVDETLRYVATERNLICSRTETNSAQLFINSHGKPITKAAMTTAFRSAVKVSGAAPRRFHDLRHAYAIRTLRALYKLARRRQINPLKILQTLLGHKDPSSTQIYIAALEEDPMSVHKDLLHYYGAVVSEIA